MCGLDVAPISYLGGAFGGGGATPTYTVATFSVLPSAATAGQRCTVTGESGLTGVVVVNTAANTWSLESVTCAESSIPALGSTSDTWYSSGGITVTAANGCWLYNTTHGVTRRWWPAATLGTDGIWITPDAYALGGWTLLGWHEGNESDATLAAQGYTVLESAGGGTAAVGVSGSAIACVATNPGSGGTSTAALYYNDAGGTTLVAAATIVINCLADIDTPTGNEGRASAIISDGTDGYDFGSARFGGGTQAAGRWFNAGSSNAAYADQVAGTTTTTSEGLLEVIHYNGGAQARFGGSAGRWSSLAATTARASASKQAYIALAQANVNGVTGASMATRRGYIMVHA